MFEKEKKYFPKITDPQCQLKWNWSTLWLTQGTTNSCHRCLKVPIDPKNFDDFHNHPHKVKEREIMLSGKWPTKENGGSGHCTYCKDIEDQGKGSDRLQMLAIPNQFPNELIKNPRETKVTPKILEIFLNDTCNMKCTYCNTRDSSQWKAEARKHGPLRYLSGAPVTGTETVTKHKLHKYFFKKTLEYIEKKGDQLTRIHLLGGETFYQSELQEVLESLKTLQNRNLQLNIISNCMVEEDRFNMTIDKIEKLIKDKHIGRFDLTGSIDGWGPEAEYARTGLQCDHFEKLFVHALKHKWMTFAIEQTVSLMTMKTMTPLIKKIKDWRKINKKLNQRFELVAQPGPKELQYFHPRVMGSKFWKNDFKDILDEMPTENAIDLQSKNYMEGCFKAITNEEIMQNTFKETKNIFNQLDQRRNTSWKKTFPYLDF